MRWNWKPVIPMGEVIKPYGKVVAILLLTGERYYHLVDDDGNVSMMPQDVLETLRGGYSE